MSEVVTKFPPIEFSVPVLSVGDQSARRSKFLPVGQFVLVHVPAVGVHPALLVQQHLLQDVAAARGEGLADVFQGGALAQAAELGAGLTRPGSGALTAFERECDNALTGYLSAARRISFGEETVIGYLYAKEQEFTAIRAVFAGRAAGLDGETIRSRLRETYV